MLQRRRCRDRTPRQEGVAHVEGALPREAEDAEKYFSLTGVWRPNIFSRHVWLWSQLLSFRFSCFSINLSDKVRGEHVGN